MPIAASCRRSLQPRLSGNRTRRRARETLHKYRRPRCVSNPLVQGADRSAYVDARKGCNAAAGDLKRNPSYFNQDETCAEAP